MEKELKELIEKVKTELDQASKEKNFTRKFLDMRYLTGHRHGLLAAQKLLRSYYFISLKR